MRKTYWMLAGLAAVMVALTGCELKPAAKGSATVAAPASAPMGAAGKPAASDISGKVTLYVPCGMIIPVRAVMDRFEEMHPQVDLVGVFDNAVILAEKLVDKGEKADVFISPGSTELGLLEKKGLARAADARTVGTFELVAIVNRESGIKLSSPEDLKKCKTISTPDPTINSVGASGKQALQKLGLWDELQPKLLPTKRAIQSHTMVAGKKTDAGIAYRNCPLETNPEKVSPSKVQVAFSFPADSYDKQPCLVVTMKQAPNKAAADAFVEFMASEEGRRLLADKGMTGCLDMDACATAADADVVVRAFYPGNESHDEIRKLIEGLNAEYDGRVSAEFVDFTSDEGMERWQAAGLTCGAILINDQQTWSYEKDGKVVEVTFKMAKDGEWTEADLRAVLDKALADKQAG